MVRSPPEFYEPICSRSDPAPRYQFSNVSLPSVKTAAGRRRRGRCTGAVPPRRRRTPPRPASASIPRCPIGRLRGQVDSSTPRRPSPPPSLQPGRVRQLPTAPPPTSSASSSRIRASRGRGNCRGKVLHHLPIQSFESIIFFFAVGSNVCSLSFYKTCNNLW
jgi:hypothetical protein